MLSRLFQARGAFRAAVSHARASARGLRANASPHEVLLVSSGLISTGEYATCAQLLGALDPRMGLDAMQLTGVAEQAMMLDDPATALRWLDVAHDSQARSASLSYLRGNALKFLGRLDAAASAFEDAIRLEPGHPGAHFALASLDIAEGRDARIARLERLVASNADSAAVSAWSYALFRELDHADATERAWPHLERGMTLRKATSRYDAAREDAIFDRIIAAARPDTIAAEAIDAERIPLFILGLPRSGTTVIERILGNHADVATCGELNELRMAYKWASDYWCEGFLDSEAAAASGTHRRVDGRRAVSEGDAGAQRRAALAYRQAPGQCRARRRRARRVAAIPHRARAQGSGGCVLRLPARVVHECVLRLELRIRGRRQPPSQRHAADANTCAGSRPDGSSTCSTKPSSRNPTAGAQAIARRLRPGARRPACRTSRRTRNR